MNNRPMTLIAVVFSAAMLAGGCYTQLMTPQEFVQTQRNRGTRTIADNSYSVNYNQSCVTCHSAIELNERADEMEYYGIRSVHNGYLLSSRDWIDNTTAQPPIYVPAPNPYWPPVNNAANSWWGPAAGTAAAGSPAERPRTDGATRDGSTVRDRPQPTSAPVHAQPPAPSGNTSAPPAPAPTVTTTPAPSAPAPANDSGRSRDGSTTTTPTGKTRGDGSSRDEPNRPR